MIPRTQGLQVTARVMPGGQGGQRVLPGLKHARPGHQAMPPCRLPRGPCAFSLPQLSRSQTLLSSLLGSKKVGTPAVCERWDGGTLAGCPRAGWASGPQEFSPSISLHLCLPRTWEVLVTQHSQSPHNVAKGAEASPTWTQGPPGTLRSPVGGTRPCLRLSNAPLACSHLSQVAVPPPALAQPARFHHLFHFPSQ